MRFQKPLIKAAVSIFIIQQYRIFRSMQKMRYNLYSESSYLTVKHIRLTVKLLAGSGYLLCCSGILLYHCGNIPDALCYLLNGCCLTFRSRSDPVDYRVCALEHGSDLGKRLRIFIGNNSACFNGFRSCGNKSLRLGYGFGAF